MMVYNWTETGGGTPTYDNDTSCGKDDTYGNASTTLVITNVISSKTLRLQYSHFGLEPLSAPIEYTLTIGKYLIYGLNFMVMIYL